MNNWQLIQLLLHSVGFYWKKFIVLSLLIAVIIGGIIFWHSKTQTKAEFAFSNDPQFSSIYEQNYDIKVESDGKVLINGKDESRDLKIYKDYYEVRVLLVDQPGTYIGKIRATMVLPEAVSKDSVEQIIYAIHGVGSHNSYMQDSTTLIYDINDITTSATVSIIAHLPKDILTPPLTKRIAYIITNVPADKYIFIAGVGPIITLIIMLFMIIKRRRDQIISFNAAPISAPPSNIPPAIAGVLIDGQVGSREIAATLIDLANRGYIYIVQRENYFTFGKRKSLNLDNLPELKPYERILLAKIFNRGDYKSTKDDVEMRVGHHIFSRKIAQVFLGIYSEATALGFFIKNPAIIHRRWRYTGITLFFFGILGFVYTAFWGPDPKFTLIFWVGEIAASSVIVKFSGLMPARSALGSKTLNQWMAFRRYLKMKKRIEPNAAVEDKFNKYLPYAIVFGVEVEWAKRFLYASFAKPDWYESIDYVTSLEKYINGLYPLISFVGGILASSHDPTVD